MFNNELVIAFVVVGQNGEPINGSILETAVEEGGNQLASALSIAVCCVNYYITHTSIQWPRRVLVPKLIINFPISKVAFFHI